MPGPWINTTLVAGPLPSNQYCMTISGLSPSTCYEYQSIFVVSGCTYTAATSHCGATQPLSMSIPSVTTGIAPCAALIDGYMTCCHTVDNNGNLTIQEYGILYTENPSYNSDLTLVCANLPTNVMKTSTCGSILTGTAYSAMTTGLSPDTLTYYRAFAVNAIGVGCGDIYSKITAPLSYKYIDFTETYSDCSTYCWSKCASINSSPAMAYGECYQLCLCAYLCACSGGVKNWASICVTCGGGHKLYCCINSTEEWSNQVLDFTVYDGDTVCVCIAACADPDYGIYDAMSVVSIDSITPLVGNFVKGTTCSSVCVQIPTPLP